MRATGTGAPPELTNRTEDRSVVAHLGDWASPASIVVTPNSHVKRWDSMRSKTMSMSHFGSTMMLAPRMKLVITCWFRAATWKRGAAARVRSSAGWEVLSMELYDVLSRVGCGRNITLGRL